MELGARISTFKKHKLLTNSNILNHKNCAIKGVGAGTINTFGIVNADVALGPNHLNHDLIVPPEFPVPGDGILGLDFLKIQLSNRLRGCTKLPLH